MSFQFGSGDIGVAIVGDVGDLQRKLGQGESAVDAFGRRTRGQFRAVGDEAGRLEASVARLGAGFKGAFVGGSIAVGLIKLKNVTMDAVGALTEAQVQVDRLRNGFSFGAGGLAEGAKEFAFVRSEVGRLGLELGGTANQYMKMIAAARGNKLAGEGVREVFKSIAEASVVMGMGADQSQRSFMAVTQMMSKGKVMAEELRGQLGEHLPGAFSIAARAMNMTEAELNKLMETGGLMADEFLPRFAAQLRSELAGTVEESTLSMQANLNRVATAWINLKQQTARGGVGNAISNEVKGIAAEISVLGETMEAARLRGDGMWASIANTTAAGLGRASIGAVELVFEGFNAGVNALTGDILNLNTNIDLMPDSLKPVAVAMELTTQKIAQAEQEYQTLAARLAQVPDNIYMKSELNQLGLYIARLREAQVEQRALMGMSVGNGGPIGSVGSGDTALARAQRADYDRRKALLDKFNFDHRSAAEKFRDEVAKQKAALGDLYTQEIEDKIRDTLIKPTRAAGQAAKAAKDEFAELMNQLSAKDSGLSADFYNDLNTLHGGYQSGRVSIDEYRQAVGLLVGQQQFAKDAVAELDKAQKELSATMAAASAMAEKDDQRYIDAADAMADGNAELRNEIQLIGLNDKQRAALVITKEMELIADKEAFLMSQQNAGASAITLQNLEREIALRRERVSLLGARDSAKELATAMEKQADEAKRFWESVDNTAHDVFVSVANEGEDAFKRIGKTLKAAVLDMLYQMTVKKWIFQIAGSFTGGAGSFGGAGLGIGDIQNAYSAYTGLTGQAGSATAAGQYIGGSMSASNAAGSIYANATGTGIDGLLASNGAYGTSSGTSLAGAGYTAAGVAGGIYGGRAISSGYSAWGGGSGNSAVNTGTAVGAIVGSIVPVIGTAIGALLGGLIGGVVNVAFGRKLTETGFRGSFDGGQLGDISGYRHEKGGWFRSDKTTDLGLNDGPEAQAFRSAAETVKEQTAGMARALGYSSESIDNYSGAIKVNLKGVKSAAEVQERMNASMDDFRKDLLKTIPGLDMTADEWAKMVEVVQASMANAGITAGGIGDILAQGAIGRLTEAQVGEQLSEVIIGGIYKTIAENAFAPVVDQLMNSIITPIFTAIMAGVPVAEVISQGAIDNIVESANRAADALEIIFNNAAFMDAMNRFRDGLGRVAAASSRASRGVISYGTAATAAANAAAQAAQAAAQERYGMETQLLNLLGDTARLRERERNALSAGNRELQDRIWAIEDAKSAVDLALESVRRAIDAEIESANAQLDAWGEIETGLKDVFDMLRENIRDLRGEVEQSNTMQGADALALIRQAAQTGVVPDRDTLSEAIDSARSAMEATQYASRFERDRAYLTLSNDLASLQRVVEPQLSAAEQMVVSLEAQIQAAEAQLEAQEAAVNALYKIDTSVLSVADAIAGLSVSMAAYANLLAQASSIAISSSAPVAATASYSGGGGYGGYSGGGGASSSRVWTAEGYWNKNPDLQAEFQNANLEQSPDFNKDPNLSARDEYLAWHWATHGQKDRRQFARGGAFTNGIVRRPTMFNIGEMGEGGQAEGILPLANIGGKLGVHAAGGSSDPELKGLVRELIQRVKAVEEHARKTAETNRDLRELAERADSIGIAQRQENVF